jgi:hypothetical protein
VCAIPRSVVGVPLAAVFACAGEQSNGPSEMTAPTAVTAPSRRLAVVAAPAVVTALVESAERLRTDVTAVDALLPANGRSAPPSLMALRGTVRALEVSLDFLIAQAGRLMHGDQDQELAFLRSTLERLEQFKDKLVKALAEEETSDAIRHAARASLSSAQSMQALIVSVIGCRTDADC